MIHAILANSKTFWMPEKASSVSPWVDGLFSFILWLSVFFTVLIVALMVLFVWRYRHREGREEERGPKHSTALELTWTIIPTILVVIIFYYGFRGFLDMAVSPANAYEIQVTGRTWNWSFTYPNGHVDSELHVPIDTPVRLVLASDDVIHSLYIPAFRVKKDAVPGRYNKMWFQATELGEFDVFCAEYCGRDHSIMRTRAVVHSPESFRAWLEQASNWEGRLSPIDAGKMLYEKRGCAQCHSIDGTRITGPSFKDLFGAPRPLSGGQTVTADENYIHDSIVNPAGQVVAGYDAVMPTYAGSIKDSDMRALIAFMKSISTHFKGDLAPLRQVSAPGATTQPSTQPSTQPAAQPAGNTDGRLP